MKYVLLVIIQLYWKLIPAHKRRKCLFNVSCSHHVYQEALNLGLTAGIRAMHYRFATCRKGYVLYKNPLTEEIEMLLINGDVIFENEIAIGMI